ncbi:cobalt-precorrin-6A reductase [Tropicimonas sp. TH_r6]|uniref:cobalt-precorrin-6A reductase n=1 Tax=Tropicimonas sp. TH_r6 TaxID=3082085 RepID=UPI0029547F75|nr:cobalt-precorrin-6A reductase [Tropicimonas sp. TH_r6]MDV7144215.1 cobalt-precorrin-6A reductase [Tropicimonas sp. TH_r6]
MNNAHLLLLGGTSEARDLANALSRHPLRLTVSLAGRTRAPAAYPGQLRLGGFGGADALAAWLRDEGVSLLVDATHPFAARISANAALAASHASIPLLRMERPGWTAGPHEDWQHVPSLEAAITALPRGARAFLTTGSGSAPALGSRPDVTLLLRAIEPLKDLPPHVDQILARPPFSEAQERAFIETHAITHLVSKNSGGAGRAKLDAAVACRIPVLMIDRPALPPDGHTIHDSATALAAIANLLALDTASDRTP